MKALIVGLLATLGFGGLMIYVLLLNPGRDVLVEQVTVIEGIVSEAVELKRGKSLTLQIHLRDRPVPFRSSNGPYPKQFQQQNLSLLSPGQRAKILVVTDELDEPRRDRSQDEDFHNIVGLEIDGKPLLTLDAYNTWARENQQTAKWVLPILFGMSLFLFIAAIRAKKRGHEFMPPWVF